MSIRVPNTLLFLKASSNLSRAARNLLHTESQVASGKRIEKLSDDASGAVRLLGLNREKLDIARYLESISDAKTLLDSGASNLQAVSDLIGSARQITLQSANQTLSQQDLDGMADTIDQYLSQALGLGNQKVGGRYLFAGTKGDVDPYTIQTLSDDQEYSAYRGNQDSLSLLIGYGATIEATLPGYSVFREQQRGSTLFSGSTGAAAGTQANTGTGNDTLLITHGATTYSGATGVAAGSSSSSGDTILGASGTHTLTVNHIAQTISLDGGTAVSYTGAETNLEVLNADGDKVYVNVTGITASGTVNITSTGYLSTDGGATQTAINFSSSNQRVVDSVTGELLNVDSTGIERTGSEYITYEGTFDLFTALKNLRDDLRNERGLSHSDQILSIQARSQQLENIHNQVLKSISILGGRSSQLESVGGQLETNQFEVASLISRLQDADLATAISEFSRAQAALQYTQSVTAKVLQISLSNFL